MSRTVRGTTRRVMLIGRHAYKFPSIASWPLFLYGLLANMQEVQFSKAGWPELCPVVWSVPGGLLVVMRRATPLTAEEWAALDVDRWSVTEDYTVPVEDKRDSFGTLDGRLVAVDYGN